MNLTFSKRTVLFWGLYTGLLFAGPVLAQGGLTGRINETIGDLISVINVLIIGFVAWAGFLIAKGESSGMTRLIYGVIGLVVVNAAYLIINYFK